MYAILAKTGGWQAVPFIVIDLNRAWRHGVAKFRTARAARAYAKKLMSQKRSRIIWTQVYKMERV